ncbi:MAG: hypothetical protein ACFCUI_09825 [Bernardetiaceae bacterium]
MKRQVLVVIFLVSVSTLLPHRLWAQYFAEEHWHEGRVELKDGYKHSGQLRYSLQENLIQFKGENLIRNFNPTDVEYFQFYDEHREQVRHFYALVFEEKPIFFELLFNGAISLLNREKLVVRYMNSFGWGAMGINTVSELHDQLFLLLPGLVIQPVPNTRRELVDLLPAHQNEIDAYIRDHRIRLRQIGDIVMVLRYYNEIEQQTQYR